MSDPIFIKFYDPRINIPKDAAKLNEKQTLMAMQPLIDVAQSGRAIAISAAQIGVPIRMLALRVSDVPVVLMNPQIVSCRTPFVSHAETNSHIPAIKRDVVRFKQITITGETFTGDLIHYELDDILAVEAQKALDTIDQPRPFSWLPQCIYTWMQYAQNEHLNSFGAINAGLYRIPYGHSAGQKLRFISSNVIIFNDDSGKELGIIDAINPLNLHNPVEKNLFWILSAMLEYQSILFEGNDKFAFAIALRLYNPRISLHIPASDWLVKESHDVGIAQNITYINTPLHAIDTSHPRLNVSAIVLDMTTKSTDQKLSDETLKFFSSSLAKGNGAVFIIYQDNEDGYIAQVSRRFSHVFIFHLTPTKKLIVGRDSAIRAEEFWRSFYDRSRIVGENSIIETALSGEIVRKDGQRVPL